MPPLCWICTLVPVQSLLVAGWICAASRHISWKKLPKLGFNIHNYFFAKALDQVRPGGVVAFVTSRYTLDAKDSTVRRYLAQRADLLGAIRLPNTAFKANAGTEVVEYMSSLTGKTAEELASELRGVIFHDPTLGAIEDHEGWVTADEYLSGNVRQKLRQAEAAAAENPAYQVNVEALRAAQPKDLDASEIEVRLGATWIDRSYIKQFMFETFDTPSYLRYSMDVQYSPYTAAWSISNKTRISYNDVAAWNTYGTDCVSAYEILEDSLNLRDVQVFDTIEDADGKKKRVLNAKETTLAAQKQQLIRDAFRDWIWADPQRRQALVRQYNEEMNSTRPREYDGSHIVFAGMNPEITLREHQRNAIAHVLYGGNTLLAHEVGAGKTFEMVAAAMESKRLGLCQKSIFVVPNHLTEQWASEFLRLYPSANILVAKQRDFETKNRKKFCARIATGDYDAVIIGHSQFEKIPISKQRQERLLQDQIAEITIVAQKSRRLLRSNTICGLGAGIRKCSLTIWTSSMKMNLKKWNSVTAVCLKQAVSFCGRCILWQPQG